MSSQERLFKRLAERHRFATRTRAKCKCQNLLTSSRNMPKKIWPAYLHYTLQTWGEEQFRRYRDKLQQAVDEICKNPLSVRSKSRDELLKDCRSFYAGNNVIL